MRLFIGFVWLLANLLPQRTALWVADGLGDTAWWLVRRHRRFALSIPRTIRVALGETLSDEEVDRLARVHARQIFETIFEVCQLRRLKTVDRSRSSDSPAGPYAGPVVRLEGLAHFLAAQKKGRGVILVSAHLGNWELLIAGLPLWIPARVAAIVLRQAEPVSNAFLTSQRQLFGTKILYSQEAPSTQAVQWLRDGGALLLLADQHGESRRNIVPFLGRDVSVPGGPIAFAQRTGAPIVPVYTTRESPGRHVVTFEPELSLVHDGNPVADFRANCRRYVSLFEEWITSHPDQWLWSYERWAWLD